MSGPKFKKQSTQILREEVCAPVASVSASNDKYNSNIDRPNATTGVAPTSGEVPNAINGCTASIKLTNGSVEFWSRIAGNWTLVYTFTGGGASNLGNGTRTNTTAPISNSNGSGVSLELATNLLAGIISGTMKVLWDNAATALGNVGTNIGTITGAYTATLSNVTFKACIQALADIVETKSGVLFYNAVGNGVDSVMVSATGPGVTFTRTSNTAGTFNIPAGVTLLSHDIYCGAANYVNTNYTITYTYASNAVFNISASNKPVVPIIMLCNLTNPTSYSVGALGTDLRMNVQTIASGSSVVQITLPSGYVNQVSIIKAIF